MQRHQWPEGLTTCVQLSGLHWEGEDKAGPTLVVQTGRSDLRGCEGVGNQRYCSQGASLCPKARGCPARSVVVWSRRCSQWHPKLGLKKGSCDLWAYIIESHNKSCFHSFCRSSVMLWYTAEQEQPQCDMFAMSSNFSVITISAMLDLAIEEQK